MSERSIAKFSCIKTFFFVKNRRELIPFYYFFLNYHDIIMYMDLCDEQTFITKFNITKETILQMPEKEIKFLLEQIHKEREINENPILKNIVIVERLSNNDITWKFYKDYLLNKSDFKILSNVISSIDKQTLYNYIKRYDELNRYELIDNLFYERKIINMKFKNIDINDILNMRII